MTAPIPAVIQLYNTKTRRKEAFAPLDPQNVRMYLCGPTVYDRAHLGNARPVVVFDVLFRLLRHVYGADHVTYVRNFTDVDDKINATALARKAAGAAGTLEELIRARTEETIGWYHNDMDALGALRPTHEPRATDYIGAMIAMIEDLIGRGHAYAKDGHVLFRVRSYAHYGALSGRSVDDMIAGARVEVAPFKEDPMDFVLWKPSDDDLPGWPSPWGRGRPGWHIECSAMSYELLGASFDIHAGGIDLQFPHHENEIAQSCCAHPEGGFANFWLHNEMLQVEGKKMSKSLGNFFTVRDLLDGQTEFGPLSGEVIRMTFLMSDYRSNMNLDRNRVVNASAALFEFAEGLAKNGANGLANIATSKPIEAVIAHLSDDLDTPAAIAELRVRIRNKQGLPYTQEFIDAAAASMEVLGFDMRSSFVTRDLCDYYDGVLAMQSSDLFISEIGRKFENLRTDARAKKNFEEVDRYKALLTNAGIEVRMGKDGVYFIRTALFDPSKLESLK